ncbi:MBP1 [Candida oxycetoniae]|uniref:Transcription factor MBP1 n=1 Tax=Candida oxycetoniae TaxID=497107 RepID=A0AAI9SYV3_9ASCO|nr:MBP1 [Candida oxycetoniae]KAI3405658.2 MBP1 [Candida oxycetoniae]
MSDNKQIYSAKYSNVPVFEFVTAEGPIMRRKSDSWINATHILKIAKLPKAKRTRILEKDVQTGIHEKVQGGYGKYQGTYVPLDLGATIARNYSVYDLLKPIFDFKYVEGETETPPPAPKHNHASALNVEKRQASLNRKTDSKASASRSKRQTAAAPTTTTATTATTKTAARTAKTTNQTTSTTASAPRKRGRPKGSTLNSAPSLKHSDTVLVGGYNNSSYAASNVSTALGSCGISRQNTEQDALHTIASNMHLKQEDLASVDTDEDEDAGPDRNGASLKRSKFTNSRLNNGDFTTQADLLTSKELFGVSRNAFEKYNHQLHNGHTNGGHGGELLFQAYHQPSINLSQENQIYNDYFANLLSYFLEDDKVRSNDIIPEKILNPPHPVSRIHINQPIDNDSNTIFHWACSMGNLTIINFLLDKFKSEINFNIRNNHGETPLMFSVKFNNCYQLGNFEQLLNILFDSLILVDSGGKTVLHHIIESKKEKIAAYYLDVLLKSLVTGGGGNNQHRRKEEREDEEGGGGGERGRGEDEDTIDEERAELITKFINHQDSDGNTAFHIAAYNLQKKLIKLFINYHKFINFNLRNLVSCTVEDYLASHNYVLRLDQSSDYDKDDGGGGGDDDYEQEGDREGGRSNVLEENKDIRPASFDVSINNSKIAINLYNNTANDITEKMTQLSYVINQELNEKDELALTYFKILNRVNEIKLSSQRDILALFKLESLIDDLVDNCAKIKDDSMSQDSQNSSELIIDTYNINFKRDQIIQEEIYRLINDLTFQILHKREELLIILKKYKNAREFEIAKHLEQFSLENGQGKENNGVDSHDSDLNQFALTKLLQLEISKKRELVNRILVETVHVPLAPKDSYSNSDSRSAQSNEKEKGASTGNSSIIEKYAADQENILIKYCKLISLSCGMKFEEVESNIDLIEQSLLRNK